jgi:hypothetical protein
MPLSLDEIRALCTKEELALVLASHSPSIEKLSSTEVKKHAVNSRKMADKWQKLSRGQARTESRKTGAPDLDSRSHAKLELFKETLDVFEARLVAMQSVPTVTSSSERKPAAAVRTQAARAARQSTRKQLHGTKKKINAAATPAAPKAATVKTTAVKSTPVKSAPVKKGTKKATKPTKTATKKGATKSAAAKQALVKTAATRAAKKPAASTSVQPKAKPVTVKKITPAISPAQKTALSGKLKADRKAISNRTSNIAGHVSAKGKRAQARRDSKTR